MSETHIDLPSLLAQYSALSEQYQDVVQPFNARITDLEVEREMAAGDLTFQMQTLEALIKPLIIDAKQTQKVPFLTAVYSKRDKWNKDLLFSMAKEVPALMQAYSITESVSFRKTNR